MRQFRTVLIAGASCAIGSSALCGYGWAAPKAGEAPRAYCARVGNDDATHPVPRSLAPAIQKLFNVTGKYAIQTTQYRCAGGRVLLCNIGANLPCSKANTATELPGATAWCKENPNADFIPMAATGHDTIYQWSCVNGVAKAGKAIGEVDARGFFVEYWKQLP